MNKEITIQDCIDLQEKFNKYAETAKQYECPLLLVVDMKLIPTICEIKKTGKIESQKEMRSMFRVVLKCIGEDAKDYEEAYLN